MKLLVLAAIAVAIPLAGCASVDAGSTSFTDAMKAIASDPRCGHVDRIQGNLGGLGGNNLSVFLERTCPPAEGVIPAPPN